MSLLPKLGKLLGVRSDEVEAVLRTDEKRARETLKRRAFMSAAAAIVTTPFVPQTWIELPDPEPEIAIAAPPFPKELMMMSLMGAMAMFILAPARSHGV